MKIELDLYERYIFRQSGVTNLTNEKFYVYLRILLACDVIHDFIRPRGEQGKAIWKEKLNNDNGFIAYKQQFLKTNAERIKQDCSSAKVSSELASLVRSLNGTINMGTQIEHEELINLFSSEEIAKNTADKIHAFLGLTEQNIQGAMLRDKPCDDFNVLNLIRTLDIVKSSRKRHASFTKYNITIDATSDKTNLTPFFSELMNRAYKKLNNCRQSNEINIINSYATKYDSSNVDALTKIFTSLGLSREINEDLEFDIKCSDLSVFNGSLKKTGNGKVYLTINSYFQENFRPGMERGSDSVDSVNGITKDMLNSYTSRNFSELFNLTIFKTMGDFLQIMTHLHLSKENQADVNVFITFDILCAKIAGILDKNVFYEKKFISEADKISGGLYTFFNQVARNERIAATSLIDLSVAVRGQVEDVEMEDEEEQQKGAKILHDMRLKRSRSMPHFGKKKPKVKKLSNKSIITKLKSVGIKITKKIGKRRVYLSRPELIKKATAFRNLQLRAKKLKVRIMYKNRKGKYVYKTAKRLHSDIKRQISKIKKPAKKSNTKKQIKQRFG